MKRDNVYIIRFAIAVRDVDSLRKIRKALEALEEELGAENATLHFKVREIKSRNRNAHIAFLNKCYDLLEEDLLCEVTVHSF